MRYTLLSLLMTASLGCSALGLFDRDRLSPDDTSTDPDFEAADEPDVEDPVEVADAVDADDPIEEPDAVVDPPLDTPDEEDVEQDAEEDPEEEDAEEEDASVEWECTGATDCDDSDVCTEDECVGHTCSNTPMDADDDGYVAIRVGTTTCGGDDCDDGAYSIHPGATEICGDGIDQDCDGGEWPMVMPSMPVPVTGSTVEQSAADLAWSGSTYGLAWSEGGCTVVTTACPLYYRRLDGDGTLVGSTVDFVDTYHDSWTASAMPQIEWGTSSFGMVYVTNDSGAVFKFTRLDEDGAAIGTTTEPTWGRYQKLLWTGSEYGMTWVDNAGGSTQTRFMIINDDGSTRVSWVRLDNLIGWNYGQSLAWTGSEFAVVWQHVNDIIFTRVDASGTEVAPGDLTIVGTTSNNDGPKIAWSGSELGLAWRDDVSGAYQVYFRRMSPTGATIGSDVRVATTSGESAASQLLWTGSEFAILWNETLSGARRNYFNTIAPDGTIARTEIPVTGTSSNATGGNMVFNGNEFGITYNDDADGTWDVMFTRIGFWD